MAPPTGGFSYPSGFALTTCCTKSWFEAKTPSGSDVIWNHEVGHRMNMVAYGDKTTEARRRKTPDAPPTIYGETPTNQRGHQGPHCSKGATYSATAGWSGTAGCVLFGATSLGGISSPLTYCDKCTDIVRKLDLSKDTIAPY